MPHHESSTDISLARQAWRAVKAVGGPAVVVAAIFFAARIDGSIVACVKAIDKLSAVVEALRVEQSSLRVDVARHDTRIAEHDRRLDGLESQEARRGRR